MKHVFSVVGCAVAVLALTSHSFARAHLTHGKQYIAAAVIVVVFHVIGIIVGRAFRPKPPAAPARTSYMYGAGTRR